MNTTTQAKGRKGETLRLWAFALVVLFAGVIFTLASGTAHAAPAAGTVIGNQATATYNDAGGTPRTATSNLVQTTVSQVKSFTLTANGAKTASPGQTVYYPHTITNTGNGSDTYALTAPSSTNFAAAAAPHSGLQYYLDNGAGLPTGAPISSSGPIAAGGQFKFVIAGTVPATAANGNTATITVGASDTGSTSLTNLDTTTVATAVINVTKALSPSSSGPAGVTLTATLSYTNSGSQPATNLVLSDDLSQVGGGFTYVLNSGRWSVSGATVLGDGAGGDPAGINYAFSGSTVSATIASVPAGFSGTLSFQVQVPATKAPGLISNFATFQYTDPSGPTTYGPNNTNTVTYQVLQTASVVANGSYTAGSPATGVSTQGANEPVTIGAAAAGSTIDFSNIVWNLGNAADTFVITMAGQASWPAGTTFTLLQADATTSLIANTTPSIPLYSAGCPAGYVVDAANQRCGYRVVLRVQLPATASGGPYSITKTATSSFDSNAKDTVIDTLTVVSANSVDLTNNVSVAGGATAAQGLGAGAPLGTPTTTNPVTPSSTGPTVSRFRLWVNNTGAVNDSFNLSVTSAVPAGWSLVFRADASVAQDCSTVGSTLTSTGTINAGAARSICAEVTVPATTSNQAAPGTYNFDFQAVSATNPATLDVKRDAITVATVNNVTLTPNNTQQTFPGGSVTYTHTLTNLGNVAENITWNALTDSRAAQGWTSAAYIDGNGNGVFDPGVDDVAANLIPSGANATFSLGVNASKTVFVRVFASATATGADPANVTTITAKFNSGASSASATDTTSVTDGLVLTKSQRTVACAGGAPTSAYTTGPIAAGPGTAPASCLQYQVVGQNTTAANITAVFINDNIPGSTKQFNAACAPAATSGTVTSPGTGNTGTISVNVGTLTPSQSVTLTFCVQIDP